MTKLYDALFSKRSVDLIIHVGLGAFAGYCIGSALKSADKPKALNNHQSNIRHAGFKDEININHNIQSSIPIYDVLLQISGEFFALFTSPLKANNKTLNETIKYLVHNHTFKFISFVTLSTYAFNLISEDSSKFCVLAASEYALYKYSRKPDIQQYYNEKDRKKVLEAIDARSKTHQQSSNQTL